MHFIGNGKADWAIFLVSLITYWLGALWIGGQALNDLGIINNPGINDPDFIRGVFEALFVISLVVMWIFNTQKIKIDP